MSLTMLNALLSWSISCLHTPIPPTQCITLCVSLMGSFLILKLSCWFNVPKTSILLVFWHCCRKKLGLLVPSSKAVLVIGILLPSSRCHTRRPCHYRCRLGPRSQLLNLALLLLLQLLLQPLLTPNSRQSRRIVVLSVFVTSVVPCGVGTHMPS